MSRRAEKLYEDFHKYNPREVGKFPRSFQIPTSIELAGPALYVLYQSPKCDPITYKKPKKPINYIHEHKDGVKVYLAGGDGPIRKVPKRVSEVTSLTRLGKFLGLGFLDGDEEVAMEASGKVDLYAIPSGKSLLVIENRRNVLAMIWGGKLRVEPRGIVG
jgi:hypothetical protein